jgi:UDP-N-acetylglucosamine kinase
LGETGANFSLMDIEAWARANKKAIAREFIRQTQFESWDNPAGIFTAGLPGAGKTEFTKELLKGVINSPLRIDMDEIAAMIEGYRPKIADKFKAGATIILERIYDEVIKHKVDFVLDGTFSHPKATQNVERAISAGYKTKLYYIHQIPEIAWKFTQDRELVERRAITRDGFIETYLKLQENLKKLQEVNKNVTISVVLKDEQNHVGKTFEAVNNIFEVVPKFLTESEIKAVIV